MPGEPLYQRLLGSAWNDLAPQIRELHSVVHVSQFTGRGAVARGRSPLSKLLGWAIGFPHGARRGGRQSARYVLRRWTLLGIPLPLWLGPRSHAYESV